MYGLSGFGVKIFTETILFPVDRNVCVCVCEPHSHSYASASYQGLLCLIELGSCFSFFSEMQQRVILLPSNKTSTVKLALRLSKLFSNEKKNTRLIGKIQKQDNDM